MHICRRAHAQLTTGPPSLAGTRTHTLTLFWTNRTVRVSPGNTVSIGSIQPRSSDGATVAFYTESPHLPVFASLCGFVFLRSVNPLDLVNANRIGAALHWTLNQAGSVPARPRYTSARLPDLSPPRPKPAEDQSLPSSLLPPPVRPRQTA